MNAKLELQRRPVGPRKMQQRIHAGPGGSAGPLNRPVLVFAVTISHQLRFRGCIPFGLLGSAARIDHDQACHQFG